jgi:uncharacterized protein (TIGR02001 family)
MKALHKTAISAATVALLSGVATTAAFAADAPAPEVSPITANVTVVNDYRYRGMTQSNFKPAIQGGFDYAHESGFYIGNWNSSISWISDTYGTGGMTPTRNIGTSAPLEMDIYAGFKKEFIGEGFASDVGLLQYYYPMANAPTPACSGTGADRLSRNACGTNPNTTEAYLAQNFTFGPLSGFAKVSYALSNLFGIYDSKGSFYPDLTVNYDTGFSGITLNAHYGYQNVANTKSYSGTSYNFSYSDYKLGLTKDFGGGLSGSVAYVATSNPKVAKDYLWSTPVAAGTQTKSAGQGGGLISLTKAF